MFMNEELLQFIWNHRLFPTENLLTTSGESVEIINQGKHNSDSGPDFFNASIRIDGTIWVGNVEIHMKSSDWYLHKHDQNSAYNNVILHVVGQHDKEITTQNGEEIPALILPVNEQVLKRYGELSAEKTWPACHKEIDKIDRIYWISAFDSLMIERLVKKTDLILEMLTDNKNNWSETFWQFLSRNFGFKKNALPFEMLARCTPLSVLAKHKSDLFQLEAMLFGQSGLLNEKLLGDDYFLKLREEYAFLSKKFMLKGMEGHIWQFMRMRPANFPTIRIAQLASLLHHSASLFSKIMEEPDMKKVLGFFNIKASEYWDTHFRFDQVSPKSEKHLGETSRNLLLINTIVPFLFVYGEQNNKPELKLRAIDLLELLPPEKNQVISRWNELGINPTNAYDTQSLIHLKTNYCDLKRCLHCQIGTQLISKQE
jgi:hypothetical protein